MTLRHLALSAVALALMGTTAFAADLSSPSTPAPIVPEAGFNWDGLYLGVQGGGYFQDGYDTQGFIGGVVGVNAVVADPIVIGAELDANYYFENDDYASAGEVLALGKIGVLATPDLLIYATAGAGWVSEDGGDDYSEIAIGGGIEAAVAQNVTLRAQVLAFKTEYSDSFDGATASVGVFFHF